MKPTAVTVLCLVFLLVQCHFTLAKGKGKGGLAGKIFGFKKTPKTKDIADNKSKVNQFKQGGSYQDRPGSYPNQGSNPQQPGGYPWQPGGYPQQPGGYPQKPGGYPQQPGGYPQQPGGYPHQPAGYPHQPAGYPHQPAGYPHQPGGYPHQPAGYPHQPAGYPHQPAGYPHQPAGYPHQPGGYPHQPAGYPHQPAGYPHQPGGYPQQPGYSAGSYPAPGSPYSGGYGGLGGYGSYGANRVYPGGYINQNPNNPILSPHYGGSFGYGGYGTRGGSPFSQSVHAMGYSPSEKSKGFGRSAMMAAAGGAVAGMALGYGLGRFPRPHFDFHNPQEEYYYNYYMYRRYGVKSTDSNDYSRDYKYNTPPQNYDTYMNSCMKRTDLLPAENKQQKDKPATATTTTTTTVAAKNATTNTPTIVSSDTVNNTTETKNSHTNKSSISAPSTSHPANEPAATPVSSVAQAVHDAAAHDENENTVSIVEIGYPALIEQMKVRRCLELYMIYSEMYLKKNAPSTPKQPNKPPGAKGGVQGLGLGLQGFLGVLTSTIVILL